MKKLGEIFKNENSGSLKRLFFLSALWKSLVGDSISNFTRPVRVSGKVLTVFVLDPIWQHELSFIKNDILERIPSELDVNEIKFVVRYFKKNEHQTPVFREVTEKERVIIKRLSETIVDENLRTAFSNAMENYFKNYSYQDSLNLE